MKDWARKLRRPVAALTEQHDCAADGPLALLSQEPLEGMLWIVEEHRIRIHG
jgi:hypothetical protein